MLVVTSASPEVSNLLRPDVGISREGRAIQRRRRKLEDRQRDGIFSQRFRDTGDLGDQRRKRQRRGYTSQGPEKGSSSERMHDDRSEKDCFVPSDLRKLFWTVQQ